MKKRRHLIVIWLCPPRISSGSCPCRPCSYSQPESVTIVVMLQTEEIKLLDLQAHILNVSLAY